MVEFLSRNEGIIKIILVILLTLFSVAVIIYALKSTTTKKVKKIVTIGVFSALSFVLYFVKIPFPIFSFLEIQFSNLPAYILGFMMGPIYGELVVVIRTLIKLPLTSSACVGEITDLIIGSASVLCASFIYAKNKTKKNALKALLFSCLVWVITSIILNYTFVLPAYVYLYFGENVNKIIEIYGLVDTFKNITESNFMTYYIFVGVLPFNLFVSIITTIITFVIYKRVSNLYKKEEANKI